PTAGRTDLVLLNYLLRRVPLAKQPKIFLHFHQFKVSPKKISILKKIAQQNNQFVILAPTQALIDIFKQNGFTQCEVVACPSYPPARSVTIDDEPIFRKVIYAGAARADKGFPELVKFVQYLSTQSLSLPLEIQVSSPFSGRYDEASEQALVQLKKL